MAEFTFPCPQCGRPVLSDETLRGKVVQCPYCYKGIVVPRIKPKLGLTPPATRQKIAIAASVATKSIVSPQVVQVECPHCGAAYEVERTEFGRQAKCQVCGIPFTIGAILQDKGFWNTFFSFFSIKGRATRGEWWKLWAKIDIPIIVLSVWLHIFTVIRCMSSIKNGGDIDGIVFTIMLCYVCIILMVLASCILMTPVTVRRLHDRNMSGWWLIVFALLPFGFFADFLIVRCLAGTSGTNDYGSDPRGLEWTRKSSKGSKAIAIIAIVGIGLYVLSFIGISLATAHSGSDMDAESTMDSTSEQLQTQSIIRQEESILQKKVELNTATTATEQTQSSRSIRHDETSVQIESRKERVRELKQKFEKIEEIKEKIKGILSGDAYDGFNKETIWRLSPTVSLRDENHDASTVYHKAIAEDSNDKIAEANRLADRELNRLEGRLSELEKVYSDFKKLKETEERKWAEEYAKDLELRKEVCAQCSGAGVVSCAKCKGIGKISTKGMQSCPKCRGEGEVYQSFKCGRCSGKGYIRTRCESCGGRGKLRQNDRATVDYGMYTIRCGSCRGSGKGLRESCANCGGEGKIEKKIECGNCQGIGDVVVSIGKEDCWRCDGKYRIKCVNCDGKGFTYRPMDEKEIAKLQRNAEQGIASAQYNLGLCYANGEGVEKDEHEAVKWYRNAASQGNTEAQFNLACCYNKGEGVVQNIERGMFWLKKAAEKSHAKAQFSLACCYENGEGVAKNKSESVKWFAKSAEQGYVYAQYNLAECYANGEGTGKNESDAMKWYRKAAEQGLAKAQYKLGLCYGKGMGKNQEAMRWFHKAAVQGHGEAQYYLGLSYYAASNTIEAVKWFHKSVEQGCVEAQELLGICYYNGEGVKKDAKEAVKWIRKAAERGEAASQYNLGVCYVFGAGVEKNTKVAMRLFRKAAEQGYAQAQFNLGVCYANGEGVEKDAKEAVKWIRKAAEQGYAQAQYSLGVCYANGEGVEKDKAEAVKWYSKAAAQGNTDAKKALKKIEGGYNSDADRMAVRSRYTQTLKRLGLTEWGYQENKSVCVLTLGCYGETGPQHIDISYHKGPDMLYWPNEMPKWLAEQLIQDRMALFQYSKVSEEERAFWKITPGTGGQVVVPARNRD